MGGGIGWEGAPYLGVHVNQPAGLLRCAELAGKGSVSPAAGEEARNACAD